jgi:hypothetical protein
VFIKQNCAKYNEQKGITCQQSIRSDHTQKEKERIKPDYCLHDIINGSVLKRKEEIFDFHCLKSKPHNIMRVFFFE